MIIVVIRTNGMANAKINIVHSISLESDACKSGDAFRTSAATDRNDMVCVDESGPSAAPATPSIVNLMAIALNPITNATIVPIKSTVVATPRIHFFVSL